MDQKDHAASALRQPSALDSTAAVEPRERKWLTVAATAEEFDIAPMTLYRLISEGLFPAVRIGRRLVIPAGALDDMYRTAVQTHGVVDAADWAHGGAA